MRKFLLTDSQLEFLITLFDNELPTGYGIQEFAINGEILGSKDDLIIYEEISAILESREIISSNHRENIRCEVS